MRKIFIVVIGVVFLTATGCIFKDTSKTKSAISEQFQQHEMINWYELMTADVEASKEFYAKWFGWTTKEATDNYNITTFLPWIVVTPSLKYLFATVSSDCKII